MYYRKDEELLKTKIIATIGPEGRNLHDPKENLQNKVSYRRLFKWLLPRINCFLVDILRLNMSFYPENEEDCKKIFDRLKGHRKVIKNVAILGDLPGAKPRLGTIQDEKVELKKGEKFELDFKRERIGTQKGASVLTYGKPMSNLSNFNKINTVLTNALKRSNSRGINISIADGEVILNAKSESGGVLHCIVWKGGIIRTKKGVTFHQIDLGLPSFEENDKKAVEFLLDLDNGEGILAYVGVSFARKPEDILKVREFIEAYYKRKGFSEEESRLRCPDIIAKIETSEGVEKIAALLDVADGAMIARGDLGLQLNLEDVPKVQKDIISLCNKRGKTAITATEMLASMEDSPKPTRAEVNDVFNAVLDGTDAVMLSGETADGKYPVQAVNYMVNIAEKAELYFEEMYTRGSDLNGDRMEELRRGSENLINETKERLSEAIDRFISEGWEWAQKFYEDKRNKNILQNITDRICHGCCGLVEDKTFKAIIATTLTGRTTRMLSRFMPSVSIVSTTHDEFIRRKLLMVRGVYPINIGRASSKTSESYGNTDEVFEEGCKKCKEESIISANNYVIFVSGTPLFTPGVVNQLQIKRIP